jgi:sec-independent protein translocase protein TatC
MLGLQYICFNFLLPGALSFFLKFNKSIVESSVDLVDLVFFSLSLHRATFFVTFWPFILIFLLHYKWVTLYQMRKLRGLIYVGAFFIGMLITPPDIVSQCFVAIPLIFLYESALMLILFYK